MLSAPTDGVARGGRDISSMMISIGVVVDGLPCERFAPLARFVLFGARLGGDGERPLFELLGCVSTSVIVPRVTSGSAPYVLCHEGNIYIPTFSDFQFSGLSQQARKENFDFISLW